MRDRQLEIQKRIINRASDSGNGPAAGLTANQAAAQAAVRALAALTALAATVSIKNVSLAGLNHGAWQLANDSDPWALATVNDWITFDNELARAGAALYQAADLRGMKLHRLVEARLELDAEIRERASHTQR